jgi:hypothetical protein
MLLLLTYDFGEIEVHDNFVVAIMKEGITVKPEFNNILKEIANDLFENRCFGYITNRKNSYAVDPRIYLQTSKIPNLIGFAVVAKRKYAKEAAKVERLFFEKPFEYFENLEDAKTWILELINKKKECHS